MLHCPYAAPGFASLAPSAPPIPRRYVGQPVDPLPPRLAPMTIHIAGLAIYPVKGLRGVQLHHARVERCGLEHDRRWAIAGPDGKALTQRNLPAMARIDAVPGGDTLRLEAAGHGGVNATPGRACLAVDVWGARVPVRAAAPDASAWLSRVLGTACTLAYMADPTARPVTPDLARPGDVVSLADGFPLLVTTAASLHDLNRRLGTPVPMNRFRPNLVIDGADAWAEDGWRQLAAGPVTLRLASPCSRCKVITLDQQTGANPARTEPLRTLGTFHRDDAGRITFGWNAVPEALGTIAVGEGIVPAAR